MPNPQQPEMRRSEKGETVQGSEQARVGGGEGGGVPPDQQSPYLS